MTPVTELAIGKSRKKMMSSAVSCSSARRIILSPARYHRTNSK